MYFLIYSYILGVVKETADMHHYIVKTPFGVCSEAWTWGRSTEVVATGLAAIYKEPGLRRVLAGSDGQITAVISSPVAETYLLLRDGTTQLLPPVNARILKS